MSDPDMIDGIIEAVSIPVMAKARIGHFAEAQVLQSLGVDYVVLLTPADYANHIDKWAFTVPFVCGATNLGEALRRITEGAAMIRSKGEAGTGDVSNAVTHMRTIRAEYPPPPGPPGRRAVRRRQGAAGAVRPGQGGRGPGQAAGRAVTAGGIATPADAAMMMQSVPRASSSARASSSPATPPSGPRPLIVKATTFYDDPDVVAKVLPRAGRGRRASSRSRSRTGSPSAAGSRHPGCRSAAPR